MLFHTRDNDDTPITMPSREVPFARLIFEGSVVEEEVLEKKAVLLEEDLIDNPGAVRYNIHEVRLRYVTSTRWARKACGRIDWVVLHRIC